MLRGERLLLCPLIHPELIFSDDAGSLFFKIQEYKPHMRLLNNTGNNKDKTSKAIFLITLLLRWGRGVVIVNSAQVHLLFYAVNKGITFCYRQCAVEWGKLAGILLGVYVVVGKVPLK